MNSCELVTLISTIACYIANTCREDEVSILAAAFTQLGDTLNTIQVHDNICDKEEENTLTPPCI